MVMNNASWAPPDLAVQSAIVLDWHDGPREGLMIAESGRECHFRIIGENMEENGALFGLRSISKGSIDRIRTHLPGSASATRPVWVPRWEFASTKDQAAAEAAIDTALEGLGGWETYAQYSMSMEVIAGWHAL